MLKKLILFSLVSVLLISGSNVLAQEEELNREEEETIQEVAMDESVTAQDLNVSEPTLLPDSPFYFLKNWARGIRSFFTFDPIKKAELKERFASERLIELKKMVKQGKEAEAIERAAERYREEVERLKQAAERIREKAEENERVDRFLNRFIRHQALHQRILHKLEEQVPPQAFERIKRVRERHLERFGEVMTKLEENKEQLRNRLENNLQKIRGSQFKDFKNIEILKELEEKIPERAKEAIRKARENRLRGLKKRIENLPESSLEKFKTYTETISGAKEKQAEILESLKERLREKPKVLEKIMESSRAIQTRIQVRKREMTESETDSKTRRVCTRIWKPVCGKDGKTYSNACFAKLAGVEIAHKGKCLERAPERVPENILKETQTLKETQKRWQEMKTQFRP